jgi:hypothetical protein
VPDTWQQTVEDDGSITATFQTTDGANGTQWFDPDGDMKIEELDNGSERTTRWFDFGENHENIVQIEKGKTGIQARFGQNSQPESAHIWEDDQVGHYVEF